jgi:hypothetical protein
MSSALEVGKKLVELCKQSKFEEAMMSLYSNDIASIEAGAPPGQSARTEGMAGVKAKADWWNNNHTVHSCEVGGPWPHGDQFIATFKLDLTAKAGPMAGKRFVMEEAALYTVSNGKVIKEEFFYSMG